MGPRCILKILINIGSDNDFSPEWCQAITWSNVHLLSIRPFRTDLSEIQIKIQYFSFMKMKLKMLSAKWQPFCLGDMSNV